MTNHVNTITHDEAMRDDAHEAPPASEPGAAPPATDLGQGSPAHPTPPRGGAPSDPAVATRGRTIDHGIAHPPPDAASHHLAPPRIHGSDLLPTLPAGDTSPEAIIRYRLELGTALAQLGCESWCCAPSYPPDAPEHLKALGAEDLS